jgi:hypothetical protein
MAKATKQQRREQARAERERIERARQRRARVRKGSIIAVAVALVAVVAFVLLRPSPPPSADNGVLEGPAPWPANQAGLAQRLDAAGLPTMTAMEQLAYHIHAHLDISVDGAPVTVPAQIGISDIGIAVLHTHDPTGIIHIEAPAPRDYTLGEFFDVWGVRLTSSCIGGYCASGSSELRTYVNGKRVDGDPRAVVLNAHDEIVLAFGTTGQLPTPIPSSFDFPPGL